MLSAGGLVLAFGAKCWCSGMAVINNCSSRVTSTVVVARLSAGRLYDRAQFGIAMSWSGPSAGVFRLWRQRQCAGRAA